MRLAYDKPNAISNAVGYAKFFSRSHDSVIRVYDEAGNVNGDEEAARDEIADHHGIPYLCDVFGGVNASF